MSEVLSIHVRFLKGVFEMKCQIKVISVYDSLMHLGTFIVPMDIDHEDLKRLIEENIKTLIFDFKYYDLEVPDLT